MRRALFLALALGAALPGCAARNPFIAGNVLAEDVLEVRWRRKMTEEPLVEWKPQEFAAAVSDGKRVYVGSSAGDFYALASYDGAIAWKRALGAKVSGAPCVIAPLGIVVVGTDGGFVVALELASGRERWRYKLAGPVQSQPVYAEGALYFMSGENRLYALDAGTGRWRWQYDREAPESFTVRGTPSPLVYGGRVYMGFSDGYLACVSAASGDIVWARALGGEATRFLDVDSTPLVVDGTMYVSSFSGGVYALDPKDGSTRWRYEVEGAGTVRVAAGRVYFAAAQKGIHALDLTGRIVWRQSMAAGGELSTPLIFDRWLVVASSDQGLYVADAATGRLAQFLRTGHGATAAPVSDGSQVYVLSNGGYFYALKLRG